MEILTINFKNIKMTDNILKLSLKKNKKIFLSTLDVYGNITEGIIDENYLNILYLTTVNQNMYLK